LTRRGKQSLLAHLNRVPYAKFFFKKAIKSVGKTFDKAAKDTHKWGNKAVKDVGKGIDKVATDTHKWGKKAVKDVGKEFKKFGKTIDKAAKDTAKWVEKAGKDVGKWTKEAVKDAGEWIENAVEDIVELIECVSGVDFGCIEELVEQTKQCTNKGECVFEFGKKCLSIPSKSFDVHKKLLEKNGSGWGVDLTFSGSLVIDLGLEISIDPREFRFDVGVKADVKNNLRMIMNGNGSYAQGTGKKGKELGKEIKLFRKVFMAGKVPVLVEVDMVPKAWIDFTTKANFNAEIDINGSMAYSQKLTVDIDDGKVEPFNGGLSGKPYSVHDLTVSGQLNAAASIRVGPHIMISVNKVPVTIDVVAKLGATMSLRANYARGLFEPRSHRSIQNHHFIEDPMLATRGKGLARYQEKLSYHPGLDFGYEAVRKGRRLFGPRFTIKPRYTTKPSTIKPSTIKPRSTTPPQNSNGKNCISGSISIEAAADVRVGLKLSAVNPIDLAREACEEAATMLLDAMNPVKKAVETAGCFGKAIGVKIPVGKINEKLGSFDAFVTSICGKALDFIIPDELEKFACKATSALNLVNDWSTILSFNPEFKFERCPGFSVAQQNVNVQAGVKAVSCEGAGGRVVKKDSVVVTRVTYNGRYFYFDKQKWKIHFGSAKVVNVRQFRGGRLIWSGQVQTWSYHGRRNPYNSSKAGQWKVGDVIKKK